MKLVESGRVIIRQSMSDRVVSWLMSPEVHHATTILSRNRTTPNLYPLPSGNTK